MESIRNLFIYELFEAILSLHRRRRVLEKPVPVLFRYAFPDAFPLRAHHLSFADFSSRAAGSGGWNALSDGAAARIFFRADFFLS